MNLFWASRRLRNTNCCFQVISFIWDGAKRRSARSREIIVADLRIFLDLGVSQRAADLLIVLRLFLSDYPDARCVSPRWEGWDLAQKSSAPRRAPRRDEKSIAVRRSPPIDEKGGSEKSSKAWRELPMRELIFGAGQAKWGRVASPRLCSFTKQITRRVVLNSVIAASGIGG